MEASNLERIKSAGRNITAIGYLLLAATLNAIIAVIHFIKLLFGGNYQSAPNVMFVYVTIGGLISIGILVNIFKAGNNLSSCDIESDIPINKETVNYEIPIKIALIKLPPPQLTIKDIVKNESDILIKYIHEYPESIWSNNFPQIAILYVFQELNSRGIALDKIATDKLELFASDQKFRSFNEMILHYS